MYIYTRENEFRIIEALPSKGLKFPSLGSFKEVYSTRRIEFENTLVSIFYVHKLDIFSPQKDKA